MQFLNEYFYLGIQIDFELNETNKDSHHRTNNNF